VWWQWLAGSPTAEAFLPPLEAMERPVEYSLGRCGKTNSIETRLMLTDASL